MTLIPVKVFLFPCISHVDVHHAHVCFEFCSCPVSMPVLSVVCYPVVFTCSVLSPWFACLNIPCCVNVGGEVVYCCFQSSVSHRTLACSCKWKLPLPVFWPLICVLATIHTCPQEILHSAPVLASCLYLPHVIILVFECIFYTAKK